MIADLTLRQEAAMQDGPLRQTALIVGTILIALGVGTLAYQASPVRYMLRMFSEPHPVNFLPLILAAVALAGGIGLLYACRHDD
jgi:di/tricarboxylate transporter